MGSVAGTILIVLLGPVPGLGHMYLGKRKKAFGLLCVFAGVIAGIVLSGSIIVKVLMAIVYFSTAIPAWIETWQISRYGKNTIDTEVRWYMVFLLLVTGFAALPLLWQSARFSKKAKVMWSIAVPVLAFLFFSALIRYRELIEGFLQKVFA